MYPGSLGILMRHVIIVAVVIVNHAQSPPITSALAENVGLIIIVAAEVGDDTDPARHVRTHAVAETLRQRQKMLVVSGQTVRFRVFVGDDIIVVTRVIGY